jgi:hypothetical protein
VTHTGIVASVRRRTWVQDRRPRTLRQHCFHGHRLAGRELTGCVQEFVDRLRVTRQTCHVDRAAPRVVGDEPRDLAVRDRDADGPVADEARGVDLHVGERDERGRVVGRRVPNLHTPA